MRAATHLDSAIPSYVLEPEKKAAPPKPAGAPTTPNFINDVAAGKVELPMIPRVVQKLLVALRDPDIDARKVAQALAQDPVLSAKVLRLANSAFFGGQRSMASIDAAVAMIGMQALNRLIVACGVASSFDDIPGVDMPTFWRDSLVAATAAHRLAPRLEADSE
jgi:HD-like signal output (HDOD) protein